MLKATRRLKKKNLWIFKSRLIFVVNLILLSLFHLPLYTSQEDQLLIILGTYILLVFIFSPHYVQPCILLNLAIGHEFSLNTLIYPYSCILQSCTSITFDVFVYTNTYCYTYTNINIFLCKKYKVYIVFTLLSRVSL